MKKTWQSYILPSLLVAFAIVFILSRAWDSPAGSSAPGVGDLRAGDPARGFSARTLGGEKLTFPEDFGDKLVLLDFWANLVRAVHRRIAKRETGLRALSRRRV